MPHLPIEPVVAAALAAHAARLNHDLGKYVALNQRWLGPDPAIEALREAVATDLLATRRGPDGTEDAASLWARHRPELVGDRPLAGAAVDLTGLPTFDALDAAMTRVATAVARLAADGALDDAAVRSAHEAAVAASEGCRRLAAELVSWHREHDG